MKKNQPKTDDELEAEKEKGLSKLTQNAKLRKRSTDKSQRNMYLFMIFVLLFAMIFVIVMSGSKEEQMKVAFLDNAGEVQAARVVPFGDAKVFHNYLKDMAIAGIYAHDESGAMNNNLEVIGTVKVINQRNQMYAKQERLFKDKRIVQYPRIIGYKVDMISNKRMEIRVVAQIIRDAFSLSGDNIVGIEDVKVMLKYELNEDKTSNYYKPWQLVDFKEMGEKKEGEE